MRTRPNQDAKRDNAAGGPGRRLARPGDLTRRRWWWLILGILLCGTHLPASDTQSLPEHQLKALYIYNFTKYVDWPATVFSSTNAPFIIGVVGAPEIGADLAELARGKRVKGRELVVRRLDQPRDIKDCQLVFLDPQDGSPAAFLDAAKDLPVLTIGTSERFLASGGIACLIHQDKTIRPRIDLPAARRVHLDISAKLLALAGSPGGRP